MTVSGRTHCDWREWWEGEFEDAAAFFQLCQDANAPMVAVENPNNASPRSQKRFGKPDCVVHPYHFGSTIYKKRTGFWLKNLPPLMATNNLRTRISLLSVGWKNKGREGRDGIGHKKPKETGSGSPRHGRSDGPAVGLDDGQ